MQGHARPCKASRWARIHQVQMYLEGDLQEIEVTSPDPNGTTPTIPPGSTWSRGLRMVYESYAIFRKLYQNLRRSLRVR